MFGLRGLAKRLTVDLPVTVNNKRPGLRKLTEANTDVYPVNYSSAQFPPVKSSDGEFSTTGCFKANMAKCLKSLNQVNVLTWRRTRVVGGSRDDDAR